LEENIKDYFNTKIDIICPLYNAEKYIDSLNQSLLKQKYVAINEIKYVLTESNDDTEELLEEIKNNNDKTEELVKQTKNNDKAEQFLKEIKNNNDKAEELIKETIINPEKVTTSTPKITYTKISKKDFSHSQVRENAAKESNADIIVFITQDVVIENNDWLYKLVISIITGEAQATYSRQLTKFNNIEKYTRESNYPSNSFIRTKYDISKYGLKTFFFSDASSAISAKVFKELNYYDGNNLTISEDMYIAYKLIMNGYKIKYCADSVVYHSHNFTLKELYERYKLTGMFFKEYNYIDKFGTNYSGSGLAKYILKRAIQDKNFKVLFRFVPDMTARFLGMKIGKMKKI